MIRVLRLIFVVGLFFAWPASTWAQAEQSARPARSTSEQEEIPAPAEAESRPRYSVAALLGGSAYGFGIGARAGATLADRVYLGGTLLFHFGGSDTDQTATGTVTEATDALQIGGEVGYALLFPPVIVRPYAGVGLTTFFESRTELGNTTSASPTAFTLWFGGTAAYRIAQTAFAVGADLRFVMPVGENVASFAGFIMGSATL